MPLDYSTPHLDPKPNAAGFFQIKYAERLANGKWATRRISTRQKDRRAAQAAFAGWLSAGGPEAALEPEPDTLTIREIVDDYLAEHCRPRGQEKAALQQVRGALVWFGGRMLAELTPDAVKAFTRARIAGHQPFGRPVADQTARRELTTLQAACNHHLAKRSTNRLDRLTLPKPPVSGRRELFLTEEQEAAFLAEARETAPPPALLYLMLGLHTAARRGAIADLRWSRVDFKAGTVDYRDPDRPETRKRRAIVDMSDELRHELELAYLAAGGKGLVVGMAGWRLFDRWRKTSSLPWASSHVLRHTYATLALRAKVPVWDVANVLADSVETVEKTYGHAIPGRQQRAVNFRSGEAV